jgi:hypothetical protein
LFFIARANQKIPNLALGRQSKTKGWLEERRIERRTASMLERNKVFLLDAKEELYH